MHVLNNDFFTKVPQVTTSSSVFDNLYNHGLGINPMVSLLYINFMKIMQCRVCHLSYSMPCDQIFKSRNEQFSMTKFLSYIRYHSDFYITAGVLLSIFF